MRSTSAAAASPMVARLKRLLYPLPSRSSFALAIGSTIAICIIWWMSIRMSLYEGESQAAFQTHIGPGRGGYLARRAGTSSSSSLSGGSHQRRYSEAPSIFVSIAAYRDDWCARTVLSLFENAAHPDQLSVAIFQQASVEDGDVDCADFSAFCPDHVLCSRLHQVRIIRVDWMKAAGPTWARHYSEGMLGNETFHLQTDGHSLFTPNWDEAAVAMWLSLDNEFAVLSSYPKSLSRMAQWRPDDSPRICVICATGWQKTTGKMLKHSACTYAKSATAYGGKPLLTAFWGAGFSFSRAHRVLMVPYDSRTPMLFDGEEFGLGARMWTHGYDIYAPSRDLIFHLYRDANLAGKKRHRYWDVDWSNRSRTLTASAHRVKAMLAIKYDETKADLRALEKYALGTNRPLAAYLRWSKVNLDEEKAESLCPEVIAGSLRRVPWERHPGVDIADMYEKRGRSDLAELYMEMARTGRQSLEQLPPEPW